MRVRLTASLVCALAVALAPAAHGGDGGLGPLTALLTDEFGLAPRQVMQVLESSSTLEPSAFTVYRFAGDADSSPTLGEDAGPVTPTQIGAHFVAWDDPAAIPLVPSDAVVEWADGGLRAGTGDGIQPLVPYLVAHVVFPTDLPTTEPIEQFLNYSILLEIPGYDGWVPDPAFPAEPWSSATHVVSLDHGPGSWELTLSSLSDGLQQPLDTSGFAIVSGNTLIFGVDMASATGLAPDWEFGVGYAGHAHDGRYGSCAECPSRISTLPGFPRAALPAYMGGPVIKPGFDPHYDVSEIEAIGGPDGFIWLDFTPIEPWDGAGMPTDHFSQYFQFGVAVPDDQAGAFFGVNQHDGELTSFGSGPDGDIPAQLYAMSDGSVVARTNFTIEESEDGIDVTFEGGYLPSEDGVFTSITRRFNIPAGEVVTGDPLTHDGARPLYDFAALQPVSPPTTAAPTTAAPTTAAPTTAAPTTAAGPSPEPGSGGTCWWCWLGGALVVGVPVGVWLLRRRASSGGEEPRRGTAES
jgi:hypothetical protein